MVPEKQLVSNADNMDTFDFVRHMNLRHGDSLGGLTHLSDKLGDYVEECYRIFHDRLHKVRIDLEHEHAE